MDKNDIAGIGKAMEGTNKLIRTGCTELSH